MFDVLRNSYFGIMVNYFIKNLRFLVPFEEEKKILEEFREPTTDIERSFFQYRCQMIGNMDWKLKALFSFFSMVAFFPTVLCLFICNFFLKKQRQNERIIFAIPLQKELIPKEFSREINEVVALDRGQGRLNFDDLRFLFKIVTKYPDAPFFCYKCAYYIAMYSYGIFQFQPEMILTHSEDSCVSSILTMYCEWQGVKHCNIQHGEKLFNIRDSFFRFSRFYVWDMHYVQLFKELRTGLREEHFIVAPLEIPSVPVLENRNECTYYLQIHTKAELQKIKECLERLNKRYKVRPHPAYMGREIFEVFDEAHIESPQSVSIWTSISSTGLAISVDSTSLFQAYLMDIPVAIDDVSNPEYFAEIKKRKYIMLSKPHKLLSEVVSKN